MEEKIIIAGLKNIAKVIGCSENTLRDWINDLDFPSKLISGTYYALPEQIKKWFAEQIEK